MNPPLISPNQKVLILTPVKNVVKNLKVYFQLLENLTYQKNLISLGMLEGDSEDGTFEAIKKQLPTLNQKYRSAKLWKRDYHFQVPKGWFRYSHEIQIPRRSILAKSRNYLLSKALQDEDWVLWLDADIIEYPVNIIEQLLAVKKDIVHPNCVTKYGGKSFDLNAWKNKGKKHLHDLRAEGDLVKIDAVGGTMLLIRANIHREGLIFPTFLFGNRSPLIRPANVLLDRGAVKKIKFSKILSIRAQGEIETEGLGIMAAEMGYECWAMPNLEIIHANE